MNRQEQISNRFILAVNLLFTATVVLLENSGSSNEYLLKNDTTMWYAEVDFVTTDDEWLVRNKIVGALKTQIPDIAPDDF